MTAGLENQGLAYYVPKDNATILKNVISVSANGANTGVMFYQPNEFTVLQDSYAIEYKERKLNSKEYLFILSALQKTIRFRFNWSNKAGWEKIKNELIKLPFLNGEIHFSYMEKCIEELEAYLKATGLKNFELSQEGVKTLDEFKQISSILPPPPKNDNKDRRLKEAKINEILTWQNSIKEISPLKIESLTVKNTKKYPFYGQSTTNNGIIAYHSLNEEVLNNLDSKPCILIHSNNQNIVYVDTPFYLKDGHAATSVLQSNSLNRYTALYLMTAIGKVIRYKFNYNAKATKIALKMTNIQIPTKGNEPDYDFMEQFIKAVQKLVIKDVVLWTDKKMKAYKKIVERT